MSKLKVNQIEANSGANIFVTGSLTVSETIIAREVRTSITSSQILVSGSTKFGDTVDDNHEFTGSVLLANDATITGTLSLGNYSNISASLDTAEDNITANSASAATALTSLSSSIDTHLDANILALSSSTDSHLDSEIALLSASTDSHLDSEISLLSASTDSHLDSEITLISSSCHSQRISEDSVLSGSAHTVRIAFSSSAATALTGLSSSAEVSRATLDTAQTAALNSYTASNDTRLDGIEAVTSSYALSATSATTGSNTFTGDQIVSSSVLLTIQPIETAPVSAATGSLIVSGSPAQLYIFNGSGSGWNRV
jgi:hypothetical protein